MRLGYAGRGGERSERVIDPWGLVDKDDVWYLLAGTEKGRRTFRVDRIVTAEVTDEPAERPADFELEAAWDDVVDAMEDRRSRTWATVLVDARYLPVMRDRFGRHCHTEDLLDDGRARVRVGAPIPLDLARNLAGWGGLVDVEGPPEVRALLARIGAELTERYARTPGFESGGRMDAWHALGSSATRGSPPG